jgi:hypothetical protein
MRVGLELRRVLRHSVVGAFLFWVWTSPGRFPQLLRESRGAVGDTKLVYAASSNEGTLTALNSLASSSTWVAGWESTAIDNTSNVYEDYRVTAKITAGTTLTAGELRMYLVGLLDDSTWPDVFDGTSSAETVTNTAIRDAVCKLAAISQTTATNSVVYYLDCPSAKQAFGGYLPKKFVVFITHSMVGALAASGNQVTVTGVYRNTAQT